MNILRIIGSMNPAHGGPVEGMRQSTAVFTKLGHKTEAVTLDNPDSSWLADYPFPVHAFGHATRIYRYSPRLMNWLQTNGARFDIVIQHGLWNYTAFATGHVFGKSNIPYFVFAHGMLRPWFRETFPIKHVFKQCFWWFSEGLLLKGAKAVFFTSEEERVRSRGAFWPYSVAERVVRYGTADVIGNKEQQIAAFRTTVPALGNRRFLLFLGRIHPIKGCDLLIRAFSRVAQTHRDIDLVIAGPDSDGWQNDLQAIARSEGIEKRIHWPGMLRDDTKWGAYRACEAFVLPSHHENFGIVVAEAMACCKPTLITNKINIWREVEQGGAGLVSTDDQAGIDKLLTNFISSEFDAVAMGLAARRTFLEKFEIESAARAQLDAIADSLDCSNLAH